MTSNILLQEAYPEPYVVKPRVIWEPHKGSQELALSCPANIILYHGTRGPGKTDVQLMRFRMRVGLGYGRFWRGVIFDREYKNLDDLVSKSMRWFPQFNDGCKFMSSKSDYKWVWPTGEELLFRVVKKDKDYWQYHGMEFAFIGWNELTKYPDSNLFEAMMSCNRSSFLPEEHPVWVDAGAYKQGNVIYLNRKRGNAIKHPLPDIPLEVFATTNPFGVGHNWVKKRFIDSCPMGSIKKDKVRVFNPKTGEKEDFIVTQCHIFGSYRENKNLSPKYIAELVQIRDKNKRKAWLGGSWDVTSGGMFDDVWHSHIHIVKPFPIPFSWYIDRAFDWGSSKPFSVGWYAKSDGTDIIYPDGSRARTVPGDIFRIAEWYGCEEGQNNIGLKLLAKDITKGIVERELNMPFRTRIQPGPADNSIWDMVDGNKISSNMAKPVKIGNQMYNGVTWNRSDKSAGSRVRGWERCREYLIGAEPPAEGTPREYPGFFVFNTCVKTIELFPILPRDEDNQDDVDTNVEDHIGDEIRYRLLSEAAYGRSGTTEGY